MPNTIAEYYKDELVDWNNSILFHNKEMQEMTQKLAEVIRRNSIVGIGEKVEAHQVLLNRLSDALGGDDKFFQPFSGQKRIIHVEAGRRSV